MPPFGLSSATDFPNAIPNVMSVQIMILDFDRRRCVDK